MLYTEGFQTFSDLSYDDPTKMLTPRSRPPPYFFELPILASGERCKPRPGSEHISREIEAKTSMNHSLTARFSSKDNIIIMQQL